MGGSSKKDTLKRTFKEFSADNMTDWAAALTYYGVLAVFPAIIALVSIIGLVGPSSTDPLLENIDKLAPGPAKDILTSSIENLAVQRGAAGIAFIVGLVLALNSASSYISAFARASNSIYDVEEGRPIWKLKPQQIGIALVLILMLVVVAVTVTVSGPLAKEVGKVVGRRRLRGHDLGLREDPADPARGVADVRLPLLDGAERQAAGVQVLQPGRHRGAVHLDRRVDPVRDLRGQVRLATTRPTGPWAA